MRHVAYMGKMRNAYKIVVRKPEGKRQLRIPRHIVLEWIFRKYGGKVWIGCIWLKRGTNGELL